MKSKTLAYRPDVDGLRAIAVLAVVVFHAFPDLAPGGFAGVDIFFVISGYLISSIIFKDLALNTFSFFDFYSRRIRRIFPSLLVVLASCYIFAWFFFVPSEFEQLGKHIQTGATFVSNIALWNEAGYFDNASETKPLLHLWSLAIEEQFYILWPLILVFFLKRKVKFQWGIVVSLLLSFLVCVILVKKDPTAAFYSPLSRFWEILIGAFLASSGHLVSEFKGIKKCASYVGAPLLIAGFVLLDKSKLFPGYWALLPTVGACLIIFSGSENWINKRILSHPILVWIGLISYPLYLWHWPLISMTNIVSLEPPSVAVRVILVISSFVLAWLTLILIEKPLRTRASIKFKTYGFSLGMVIAACIGFFTYEYGGLPGRYPEEVRLIAEKTKITDFDWENKVRSHTCHIQVPDREKRPEYCIENGKPSVFLWGDSHAAALYPGLRNLQGKIKFGLSQFTHVGNPPFLKNGPLSGLYEINNQDVFDLLVKKSPDVVILHAAWYEYKMPLERMVNQIDFTISKIKSSNPKIKIVVIGPVPTWKDSLQKNILKYYMNSTPRILPPLYMAYGLRKDVRAFDESLKNSFNAKGIQYLSVIDSLCNSDGCMTRTGPSHLDLTAIDYGHLSEAGSVFLINKIASKIF